MSQKVVFPVFKVPGETPRWAIRAMWGGGAVVVLAAVGLVGLVARNQTVEAAALQASVTPTLAAPAPGAPALAGRPAPAAVSAAAVPSTSLAAAADDPPRGQPEKPEKAAHHRGGGGHHGKRATAHHSKTVAKATPASAPRPAKKTDALDELLRSVK